MKKTIYAMMLSIICLSIFSCKCQGIEKWLGQTRDTLLLLLRNPTDIVYTQNIVIYEYIFSRSFTIPGYTTTDTIVGIYGYRAEVSQQSTYYPPQTMTIVTRKLNLQYKKQQQSSLYASQILSPNQFHPLNISPDFDSCFLGILYLCGFLELT